MNAGRPTADLVADLVGALEPVRPLPALRWQIASLAGTWFVTALAVAAWHGLHPAAVLDRGVSSTGIATGLALLAGSALAAALATRIPGRERALRTAVGGAVLSLGLLLAVWIGLIGTSIGTIFHAAEDLRCVGHASLFSAPSGLVAGFLAARGIAWRPVASGFSLAIGAAAAGALLTHLSCLSDSTWHWLFGHAVGPLLVGVVAGSLLAWGFGRAQAAAAGKPVGAPQEPAAVEPE
jgi:MFS family permease